MGSKIYINKLRVDSVCILTQQTITVDGMEYTVGLPDARSYINSEDGRAKLTAEVPSPYKDAVFAVWGDTPTVTADTEEVQ